MEPDSHAERIRRLDPDQLRRLRQALQARKVVGNGLIAQGLVRIGVTRLYALSGSPIDEILKKTVEQDIEVLGVRSQFGATVMSGIENFITGRLDSAVCVSAGPAVTNCATGIHVAQANHRPLLVLGSRRGHHGEEGAFQHASFVEMMSPITKWSAEVPTADDILPMMKEARRIALDGQPGPVYLEFPEYVLTGKGSNGRAAGKPDDMADLTEAAAASLDVPVELIGSARRPLLCLSENLRWGWDAAALRSLVERNALPFMTTPMGRGLLPDTHPLCFNSWRRRALQKTDLFILVGGALDWRFRHGRDLAPGCKVVQIGLDADLLGMNVANAWQARMAPAAFVKGLWEALPESLNGLSGWHDLLAEHGSQSARPFARDYVSPPGFVDPEAFFRGLHGRLPEEAIVVIDGSICLSMANHLLRATRPFSWFDPGLNGCIGSGIPQAIGAKLAAPDRPVVAIIGDTGFGISGTELETAARYGIAVKVIVFNNSGITGAHRDRRIFGNAAGRPVAGYQRGLRYDRMAEGLGVKSACSDDTDTALEQFDSMLTADGPACLNLQVDPDFPVPDIW